MIVYICPPLARSLAAFQPFNPIDWICRRFTVVETSRSWENVPDLKHWSGKYNGYFNCVNHHVILKTLYTIEDLLYVICNTDFSLQNAFLTSELDVENSTFYSRDSIHCQPVTMYDSRDISWAPHVCKADRRDWYWSLQIRGGRKEQGVFSTSGMFLVEVKRHVNGLTKQ